MNWREDYELDGFAADYRDAARLTAEFSTVDAESLARCILEQSRTIRVFRTILGFTGQEFAAATVIAGEQVGIAAVPLGRLRNLEAGRLPSSAEAEVCAAVIDQSMRGVLFSPPGAGLRPKLAKPDTLEGWATVHRFAQTGVPYSVFLHQRHYGGSFRQLLDATSGTRGGVLEDAVEELFNSASIQFLRTTAANQREIETRFGLTVRPAPDFVAFDANGTLRCILECKAANDGGTARDKAARFRSLRTESQRLGGVPVFAVLAGLGWRRVRDALGPVVQATDGRVFTLATLPEMLTVQPFPTLGTAVS